MGEETNETVVQTMDDATQRLETTSSGNGFDGGDMTPHAMEEESFADLLSKESNVTGRLDPGQRVKVRIITISNDVVYVDLGGKSEGVIDASEFITDDGAFVIREGDEIEAFYVASKNGVRRLTTRTRGYSIVDLAGIRDAYEAGMPVSGKVRAELKGGFEVFVGKVRCFCPFSQMDLRGAKAKESYVGQVFPFKVLEYGEEGRNIVLSRRSLLEEEREAELARVKQTLSVGMELDGKVRSLQKFGAFVDVGGIDGLVPLSEMAWGRTDNPGDVLTNGQEVRVKVIGIDWDRNRLTLSLKALQADPWEAAAEKYAPDSRVGGTVVRLAPFGAFVNIEPGIDGLIHISQLAEGRRIKHPKEVVEVGQWVEAYVLAVDSAGKRLSLSLKPKVKKEEIVLPQVGDVFKGVVERVMPYGIFVKIDSGVTGLVPNAEVGTPKGTNHAKMFPQGMEMEVVVTAVDTEKGKVALSRTGVAEKAEKEAYTRYQDSIRVESSSAGLGSFGELLRASLESKK